jgi:hypothetical protein
MDPDNQRLDPTRGCNEKATSPSLAITQTKAEQAAMARDQDTWHTLMEQALVGLNCTVIQSTSDEAPGLLAYVEHHLGVHHSSDLFHVQHELSRAVSAPLATKQRAAAQATTKAEERLTRMQEQRHDNHNEPIQRGPGRPPKVAASLEQAVWGAPIFGPASPPHGRRAERRHYARGRRGG